MASNTVVQTNVLAINSHRNLGIIGANREKASAKLSSGYRINTAADDAAGLAISEKMRSQIRGLDMASRNAQDGISMLQTTEGGLTEIDNMIIRIGELVTEAANDTNTVEDREKVQLEISELIQEIADMGERVEFNTMSVLNMKTAKTFQIGANSGQGIMFNFSDVNVTSDVIDKLGTVLNAARQAGVDKSTNTFSDISSELDASVDEALKYVTEARARLGAVINRLEYTNRSLQVSSENLSAAESRIRDADMGKEMMQLTKSNILQQAGVSMLAQANQSPQSVLQLLQ
jgi:flagellin